jgi:hypothetical protein
MHGILRRAAALLSIPALATLALTSVSLVMAGPASADTSNDCPATQSAVVGIDNNVTASSSTSGDTVTYTFGSVNAHGNGGQPGLIEYCVYASPLASSQTTASDLPLGWAPSGDGSHYFGWQRPNGDPTNIPFDGNTYTMGTATWSGPPPTQTIVLHVYDPSVCAVNSSNTCYVYPGTIRPPQAQALTVSKDAAGAYTTTYGWTVTKSVDPSQLNLAPGQQGTAKYTVTVTADQGTNSAVIVSGHVTINNPNSGTVNSPPTVTDSLSDGTSCNVDPLPASLPPGPTTVGYTCTTDSNFNFGTPPTNKAVINWTDQTLSGGSQLAAGTANTGDVQITLNQSLVDNCVTPSDPQAPAGTFSQVCANTSPQTFTYSVTYTGGTNQNSPNPPGTCTDNKNTVVINANDQNNTQVGHDSADVSVCVGAPLGVTKTATPAFSRDIPWTISKNVDKTEIDVPNGQPATANYTVDLVHGTPVDSGWTVTGKITVSNPNTFEDVTLTDLKDAIDNHGTCEVDGSPGLKIPAKSKVTYDYQCVYQNGAPNPLLGHNTATATWNADTYFTATGTASGEADADFGSTTPTITNGSFVVNDPMGGGQIGAGDYTMPNPIEFHYSHAFTGDPGGQCTEHDNTATFTASNGATGSASQAVNVCVGLDLTVQKDAHPSFIRTYKWGINKTVDNPSWDGSVPGTFNYHVIVTNNGGTDSGWLVTGSVTVSNPNQWEDIKLASSQGLVDQITGDPNANCSFPGGDPSGAVIGKNSSSTFQYICQYSGSPAADSETNVATASWDNSAYASPNGSASRSASWQWSNISPAIVNGSVDVYDSVDGGPQQHLGKVNYFDPSPKSFDYTRTFGNDQPGHCTQHSNVATFIAQDNVAITGSTQPVGVSDCIGADLQVSKTANPSFDRTYLWNIQKAADKTTFIGGTVHYTITVNQTGVQDGNYKVSGSITVTNPNDWEGISLQTLTDAVNNGGTCTVGGPALPLTILASGSQVFPYTCTYASKPSNLNGHNTATATWLPAFSPNTSGTGGADFAFGAPTNLINKTIHVTDPQAPSNPLGTLTGTDQAPFASGVFKYSKTFPEPASGCQTINNTATITETGQNASASVKDCALGGLTMGFWHNMNGQAIIKGSSTVGNWLRQFAPFQDLPVNATGAQVAAYDVNVFNAATCGGSTCNAMLKAQMLATALNVYFSDPALGTNKIGAPAPIGPQTIDLTHIGGSENVSAAFGGATSMTVLQMLTYAAGKSNVGGSVWYGQVKATQVLAADAFNGINNNQVMGP